MLKISLIRCRLPVVIQQLKMSTIQARASIHIARTLQTKDSKDKATKSQISDTLKELQMQAKIEKETKELFERNPHLKKLAEDFSSHDHIHMRESETEKNDSITFGSTLHKSPATSESATSESATGEAATHGHSHSHLSANPLLVLNKEQFKKNPGVRITWIGLFINVGMVLGKFVGGIVFHSQALFADSIHALGDLVSDFLTLFSVSFAQSKPNPSYPYGFGKVETVGSLAVSTILAMAGISIGWSSLCAIVGPIVPQIITETMAGILGASHSHSHSAVQDVTNINAAWIAAISIAAKEWIFQATKKVAIQTNSNVLMANAWHHRVDSLTSLVALVTITSGHFLNIQSLDALGGLIVSGLVLKAGAQGILGSVKELIDQAIAHDDPRFIKTENTIDEVLSKLVSNNNSGKPYQLKDLMVLSSGPNLAAHATLIVPLQQWDNVLGVKEFEIVTDHLRHVLYKDIPNMRNLSVEFVEEKPELTEEEKEELSKQQKLDNLANTDNDATHSHDHSHESGHNHDHSHEDQSHKH